MRSIISLHIALLIVATVVTGASIPGWNEIYRFRHCYSQISLYANNDTLELQFDSCGAAQVIQTLEWNTHQREWQKLDYPARCVFIAPYSVGKGTRYGVHKDSAGCTLARMDIQQRSYIEYALPERVSNYLIVGAANLFVNPVNDSIIYFLLEDYGGDSYQLFISANGGESWHESPIQPTWEHTEELDAFNLEFNEHNPLWFGLDLVVVQQGTNNLEWREFATTDGGLTYSRISPCSPIDTMTLSDSGIWGLKDECDWQRFWHGKSCQSSADNCIGVNSTSHGDSPWLESMYHSSLSALARHYTYLTLDERSFVVAQSNKAVQFIRAIRQDSLQGGTDVFMTKDYGSSWDCVYTMVGINNFRSIYDEAQAKVYIMTEGRDSINQDYEYVIYEQAQPLSVHDEIAGNSAALRGLFDGLYLRIQLPESAEVELANATVCITDILGRVVQQSVVELSKTSLSLQTQIEVRGLYFVSVCIGDQVFRLRVNKD